MSSPLDHKHHKQTQQGLNLHSSGSEPDAIPVSPCACIRKPSLRDSNAHFRVRSPVFSPFILREGKVPWRCRSAPYGFANHIHLRMERDIKSWRKESNLRFPGYQPGALTAVLRQGIFLKHSGRNSNPQLLLRRQAICPVNRPEYEQGLPGSNRRLRFWRPLCFQLHQAPLSIPDRIRTCTAGTGIRYGRPFHHGDKALPKRFELLSNSLEGCCSRPLSYGNMLRPQVAFSMFSVTIFLAKEKPPAPLTDGHDNTKDLLAMMEESWHPCTHIPYISFGQHKQTNLPSANSPLDMLMPALNGCICVHGVYLPFLDFLIICMLPDTGAAEKWHRLTLMV